MRRLLLFGLIALGSACSGGNNPSVSEAPHPSSSEKSPSDAESVIIKKANGLEAEVLVEGTGRRVRRSDWITVHYRGSVINQGTSSASESEDSDDSNSEIETEVAGEYVFGDTFKTGVPLRLSLQSVQTIDGWQQGLPGLRVGARLILRIPSALAYGEKGLASTRIPADADLEYEIEILDAVAQTDRR